MWLHVLLLPLLVGITCSGLKLPLLRRDDQTPPSKPAGRSKLPPKKRLGGGGVPTGSQNSSKASKRGFVRPKASKAVSKVGSVPERDDAKKFLSETGDTAQSIITGTSEVVTEVVVRTLVNTGPANALLTPLHKWSRSRKRVAEAVKAAGTLPMTAAERERRKQQRALFEQQEEIRTNPWLELLRDTVPVPQSVKNTYNALVSVAAVPGQLVETGKQTAESLKVAAETAAAIPDRVSETVARTQATVKTAQEVLVGAPDRVQDVVTTTRELPGRVERAVGEGVGAAEAAMEAGRKAAEAVETLPSRLPDLMETVADDALSLAEGTATGVDEAGAALWGLTKDVAVWATDLVLRQALAPVHEYRTSAKRVQAALDEEQAALPQTPTPSRSSVEKAPSSPALLVTVGTAVPPGAGDSRASEEDTTPDMGDSMPVSRLAGLRGRFSSWRRKRKSIPAVTVADEDDEDDGVENVSDSKETNAAVASSKPAISQEPRAETVSAAAQADSRMAARRSGTGAKPLGDLEVGVGATAKAPAAENALVTDRQVAAGEVLLPVTASVSGGGSEASSKERVKVKLSPAPVGALAVSVASEDRGAVKGAAVPAAARALGAAGSEIERKETSPETEREPVAKITVADPSDTRDLDQGAAALVGDDEHRAGQIEVAGEQEQSQAASSFAKSSSSGGASSGTMERPQAGAKRAGGSVVGEADGDDTSREQNAPPSPSRVAATAPSKGSASAVPPSADMGSDDKDALLGGPDVDTPAKATGNPGESAAGAAVTNAKDTVVSTPTVSTSAGSTAREQQVGTEAAPFKRGERSADSVASSSSPSSPVPTGAAPPLRPSSRNEAPRKKKGNGNLAAQQRLEETPTKTEETEVLVDEAGPLAPLASVEKPAVPSSKTAKDEAATGAEYVVPRVAGKTSGVGGGSDTAVEGPSSAWDAMNPAAEFLKDWVDKAVPQKKAELKRRERERAVCWERQWYPVAIVSELLQQQQQQQQQRRFEMLDRAYELALMPHGGQGTGHEIRGWECKAVADPNEEVSDDLERTRSSAGPAATATSRVPLRESNGLLWAWPDTSPAGLAAAELASPASLPEFLGADGLGSAPGVWRRLLRRQATPQRVPGSNNENGTGGQEAERENSSGNQPYVLCVEQEISCGFSDAVRGLLAASHGQAVRAVAAGGGEDGNAPVDEDLLVASSLAGGSESSSGVLRAAFDTPSVQGEVMLSSPTVVEWRFSPAPRPAVDGSPVSAAQQEPATATATATATKHEDVVPVESSRRRSWLRRRLSGLGRGGRGGDGDVDSRPRMSTSAAGGDHRDRRPVEGGVRKGGAANYVVSLLPVGPNRTKVFARLEIEPSGVLGGRSLWWSRRIRRALLVAALDQVASVRSSATSGGGIRSQLLSSAAEAWLEGAAGGGPF